MSTFDFNTLSGSDIHIEMRDDREITHYKNLQIAPTLSTTLNPSFDVTDSKLITGIISEKGLVLNPNLESMKFFRG
jgi:methylthioribose-1-phosphate isomerase